MAIDLPVVRVSLHEMQRNEVCRNSAKQFLELFESKNWASIVRIVKKDQKYDVLVSKLKVGNLFIFRFIPCTIVDVKSLFQDPVMSDGRTMIIPEHIQKMSAQFVWHATPVTHQISEADSTQQKEPPTLPTGSEGSECNPL